MKNIIATLAFATLAVSAFGAEEEFENYKIDLDWNDPKTLSDNMVQQCDDSYFPAFELKIPGQPRKDFYVKFNVDVSRGKLSPGCNVKMIQGSDSTTYLFDAGNGGCTIKVDEVRKDWRQKRKQATYEIGDAC